MGWLVLRDHFGPLVYGISFGIIAGMYEQSGRVSFLGLRGA